LRQVTYDEELAHRTRELLGGQAGLTEKPMFGGLAFLLHGNMSVAVSSQGGLLVRVAPERSEEMISKPHASLMQMGSRSPMKGWIRVAPEGLRTKRELAAWVKRGTAYSSALPPKR
jgi:TfoX/Sxy family transcriptional regulator of competence genes